MADRCGVVAMQVAPGWFSRPAMIFGMTLGGLAFAQTLQQSEPVHLVRGVNRGTLDSTAGNQSWDFTAESGRFQLVFAGDRPEQVFTAGHTPEVRVVFSPPTSGAAVTRRAIPGGGTVFTGRIAQRTHVVVVVQPVKNAQARETTDYTLVVTGNVDFNGPAAGGAKR